MKNLTVLLLLLVIISCDKKEDTCFDNINGNYTGTCTSIDGVKVGTMHLSQTIDSAWPVSIVDDIFNHEYIGIVSEDCNTIEVDYSGSRSDPFSISGTFQIHGDLITGEMNLTENNVEKICTYSVTKI